MPLIRSVADTVTRRMPRIIPVEKHIAGDMVVGGAFLGAAIMLRKNHPRTASAAALLGAVTVGAAFLTDYSGESPKPISLQMHRNIDLGLASIAASIPSALPPDGGRQSGLFLAGAVALTALANLTAFPRARRNYR